jgi:hypothetical protein
MQGTHAENINFLTKILVRRCERKRPFEIDMRRYQEIINIDLEEEGENGTQTELTRNKFQCGKKP